MEKSAEPIAAPEKTEKAPFLNRALRIAAYPLALISGFWMTEKQLHDNAYQNLKRYKAFDDFLKPGESGGLEARNLANVQDRIHNRTTVEEFLEKSAGTKMEYSAQVTERMEHMGLGKSYTNFIRKWNYNNSGGKTEAWLKGATVTGIVAVVVLTMAQSKSLLEFLGFESNDKGNSR